MIVRSVCVPAAVAAVLIMVACAPHGASEPPFPERDASAIRTVAATTTPSPESVLTTIEADTASVAAADEIPGVLVDFVYHGKSYTYSYGVQDLTSKTPVTASTAFEIGSVTKSFTALDYVLALDNPSLDRAIDPSTTYTGTYPLTESVMDGNLTRYKPPAPATTDANGNPCPKLAIPTPLPYASYSASFKNMRLRDLAEHGSTLPDQPPNPYGSGTLAVAERPCYPSQVLVNYVETYVSPAGEAIGKYYDYSDIGYGILGDWLSGFLDTDYFTLTAKLVLEPLGMPMTLDVARTSYYGSKYATAYSAPKTATYHWPVNAWPGGGTLRSTGTDMMTYLHAALLQSSNAPITAAMREAETLPSALLVNNTGPAVQHLAWATGPVGSKSLTATYKDGATGGMTAWIGLENAGTANAVGIVVMTNLGTQSYGAPATNLAVKILNDVGP